MVKNRTLLLIASIVWLIAGFNVVKIGFTSYIDRVNIINLIGSAIIFSLFWFKVFSKLVDKHTVRIKSYAAEKQYFWNFFDLKSFAIMAFMMTFGILIRVFNLMPEVFIAVFYSGLGLALALAGVKFGLNYFKYESK